jgi:hypothetical protein
MCRLYPFGFSRIGSRWAVDTSLFCRSIREDRGAPLGEIIPEWSRLLSDLDTPQEPRHAIAAGRPLSGEVLWKIEHHLLELLSRPELTLYDRVRCCLQFGRLATSGDPSTAAAEALRQAIAKGLPRQIRAIVRGGHMDAGQRSFFFQWLFFVLNPLPVGFDRLPPAVARREREGRLAQARRFSQNLDPPVIDNRELSVGFAQVAAVDPGVLAEPGCRAIESFLKAKVLGQRWLSAGSSEMPVTEALPLFLLTYPMTIWTAKALAAEAGAGRGRSRRSHSRPDPAVRAADQGGKGAAIHRRGDRARDCRSQRAVGSSGGGGWGGGVAGGTATDRIDFGAPMSAPVRSAPSGGGRLARHRSLLYQSQYPSIGATGPGSARPA